MKNPPNPRCYVSGQALQQQTAAANNAIAQANAINGRARCQCAGGEKFIYNLTAVPGFQFLSEWGDQAG